MPRKRSRARRQLDDSSSDDDDSLILSAARIVQTFSNDKGRHGGSVEGHRVLYRDREGGHDRMFRDYLADNPTYGPEIFRRRYRMSRELFLRIMNAVEAHDEYFVQKRNAANVLGLSCFQKVTAAMRMLTYGVPADATDEYVRIGESTALESLRRFVAGVVEIFGDEYLRYPNEADTARLLALGEQQGFPGMLGSIVCMHWAWKNCPYDKQGQYKGHVNKPTIILEAVASNDLWIWHAFFGMPGSHNDINVLHRSPLFDNLAEGRAPEVNYSVNGHDYNMGYYLADGIYPSWATLVKSITLPMGNKRQYFAKAQEAARKMVERAFGVLQSRFAIVRGPARFWDIETLALIMRACVIMHNMIVEDEGFVVDPNERFDYGGENVQPARGRGTRTLDEYIEAQRMIRNKETHVQMKEDLIEHLWNHHPDLY
ncbi:protein ALP1-like [Miscanthus floridulus]|uniref:protein ALP1-like n=1 Tax=Miscanthus floridulus TaxID=154761 RepID=UPI0034584407